MEIHSIVFKLAYDICLNQITVDEMMSSQTNFVIVIRMENEDQECMRCVVGLPCVFELVKYVWTSLSCWNHFIMDGREIACESCATSISLSITIQKGLFLTKTSYCSTYFTVGVNLQLRHFLLTRARVLNNNSGY
ncbi:hypothetical protein TNIN_42761 [Trichonephila inaurata madagascariensis]|uniref:Uncharacterized protein n=1 Tax=Trichonephila inaurata madagascariensis TaxID=2747483 RepID=A0A8X6WRA3_9ARAC|nr:hypothetical protein TNIN_42761 [Trichonephila inaurata madagascariensis]